ncbi:hypothetical protein Poli38472_014946 [Pythium oligandrum]|uniref:Reverse transcriptase domain-containing protein n=1 Tax=Pythium oligandrum TaxID=41045 RepID=A0A8K1CJH8_PYTOL|nr:hypothetical protein Poli38472_014946 [Pythium oligandrum]|eukprot:TMW63866.1 hypothetical protein Poli38472_014946 [Pythium oligandrum]
MAPDRAPGPDGLPLAYYKTDIHLWSQVLECVYAAQFALGRMTKFQRRGQIILLYKKGDKRDPLNHRPITLLNMDAKIPPKVLARRMGPALQTILGEDQYGFVLHGIYAMLIFVSKLSATVQENTTAGAVLLDFAKAFDSVVWDALDLTLTHFGFGENFCEWVKTFFKDSLVSILFNGDPLPSFQIGAGVRQGDRCLQHSS